MIWYIWNLNYNNIWYSRAEFGSAKCMTSLSNLYNVFSSVTLPFNPDGYRSVEDNFLSTLPIRSPLPILPPPSPLAPHFFRQEINAIKSSFLQVRYRFTWVTGMLKYVIRMFSLDTVVRAIKSSFLQVRVGFWAPQGLEGTTIPYCNTLDKFVGQNDHLIFTPVLGAFEEKIPFLLYNMVQLNLQKW